MQHRIRLAGVLALSVLAAGCEAGKVADESGRKLTLVAPSAQKLAQGETNKILVAIARTGVEGPVRIRFEGLPSGVSVVESTTEIPADASTATFTLHAANDAQVVADSPATVTAVGPGGMSVSERFNLNVVAAK